MDRHTVTRSLIVILPLALAAGAASAQQKVLFSDNFESDTVKPQWTWVHLSERSPFTQFSGRYSYNTIKLSLNAPTPPPGNSGNDGGGSGDGGGGGSGDGDGSGSGGINAIRYTLSFDFYAIDSWDGNDMRYGPDRFEISNGKQKVFSETFGNVWGQQTYREPDVGRFNMAYGSAADSIYRNITVQFEQQLGEAVKLSFYDLGLQGLSDESWGIDNVQVKYEFVPAPATLPMIAGGGLLALRRRRR